MARPLLFSPVPRRPLCHICEQVFLCRPAQPAKRTFVTANASSRRTRTYQEALSTLVPIRSFATAKLSFRRQIEQRKQAGKQQEKNELRFQSVEQQDRTLRPGKLDPQPSQPDFANLTELAAAVDRVSKAFLAQQGIPSEEVAFDALRACAQADLKRIHDVEKHQDQAGATPSPLLDLDPSKKSGRQAAGTLAPLAAPSDSLRAQDVVDKISAAAYTIISHPNVVITPKLLKAYVKIQAHFGKPETLPEVLELFAAKPTPQLSAGSIKYVSRNPGKTDNAVDKDIAESALDVAIEAKDLDAAIGIIESSYAATAFVRSKVLRGILLPATLLTLVPLAAVALAQQFSLFQDAMDQALASKIALAGMLAYAGFMASLGVVVVTTANDQMKRVTWTPGTPLRDRWMREEERAALDKVACAFGFSDKLRWGEEVGAEWDALREYVLRRSMILDSVELMEDVN